MGSISAMNSIQRVLERHGPELVAEEQIGEPGTVLEYRGATIEGGPYNATITHAFVDQNGHTYLVTGRTYDIGELAERFPDCAVAY